VQVLFGNGAGGFVTGPGATGHAARPQGVAAADFNRDGHLDLVVAHESASGLSVLTGNGGSAFTAQSIPGIANLNVVAIGDFNRDGRMDVAAASTSDNRVGLYLGTSSGLRFNASYPTGASPRDVIARDINHDGALDVVTPNRSANSVSVLLGSTSMPGTLQPAETFSAGAGSRVVAAEDFDHDGRIDLVTGNQDASSVTFLWNDTVFDTAAYSFSRRAFGTPSNETGGRARAAGVPQLRTGGGLQQRRSCRRPGDAAVPADADLVLPGRRTWRLHARSGDLIRHRYA
jgi:hypothetical protein